MKGGRGLTGESQALAAFRSLLEETAQPDSASPVQMTDGLVGPAAGVLLRRCAVPHDFDRALLGRLSACNEAEADERYAQFAKLSMVQMDGGKLSVHERWRRPLWRWWLDDAQRREFQALSEVLVEWFIAPANCTGEDPVARRRMFHLIGCRKDEGLQMFEAQFCAARHNRRFSECALLLRLVHEYDPILNPRERALLTYQEGKLASDLGDWDRSLPLLRAVSADANADPQLRVNAQVRIGHALSMTDRKTEALALLEELRERVVVEPAAANSVWRVLYELGEVYRDLGLVDKAIEALTAALAGANDDEKEADVAGMRNCLGTVQLKLREIDGAIKSFQASLDDLRRRGDAIGAAVVLNNLGLAQLERCDWKSAEETLAESLQNKLAAGDVPGQATTLLNLSKAQAAQKHWKDACSSAEEAIAIYETVGDACKRAQARLTLAKYLRRGGRRAESAALLQAVIGDAQARNDTDTARKASAEFLLSAPKRGTPRWGWALIAVVGLILLEILLN